MNKKILITLCLLAIPLAAKAVTPTITQNNSQNTSNYNTWFNTGVAAVFGNYPNADIYYDGTNLVIDVLHGGGTVSFPHGASIGSLSPDGMMTFPSGSAVTSGSYQIGRDNGGTNALHLNVPTGASILGSVNGVTKFTLNVNGFNGVIGATTPAAGTFTTIAGTNYSGSGTIKTTNATGAGAHKLSGANTACNTTCSSGGCLFGFDLAAGASQPVMVECADATADTCLCLQ